MKTIERRPAPRSALLLLAAFAALSASSPVRAQTNDTASEQAGSAMPTVRSGAEIVVEDTAGRRLKARFREWSGDALLVTTEGRSPEIRQFPLHAIRKVTGDDSRVNGFWIGFGFGTVPGIVLGSLFNRRCENENTRCPAAMALFGALTGLGGGALGAGIDGTFRRGPVIFSRGEAAGRLEVGPVLDPIERRSGLALSIRF